MLRLWCEWDYGQENFIFTSEAAGRAWLEKAVLDIDGGFDLDDFPDGISDYFDQGLAGFGPVTIIGAN